MGSRFPELRLCDLEWKIDQIATDNYPSWYTNWLSNQQNVKKENGDGLSLQSKRSRKASEKFAGKRIKLEGAVISDDQGGNSKEGVSTGADGSASNVQVSLEVSLTTCYQSHSQMDVSSTFDINIGVLDTGITAGPSTIIPVNVSNDSATGADGSASNVQVGF